MTPLRPPGELESLDIGRRLAWLVTTAARRLGLPEAMPCDALLDAILRRATADPAAISPDVYRAVYALRVSVP